MTEATDENAADEAQLTWARQAVSQIVAMAWHLRARIGEPVEERVRDAVLALVTQRSPRAKAELIRSDPALAGNEVELLLDTAAEVCRQMPGSDPSWPRFFMSHLDIVRLVRVEELRPEDMPAEPPDEATRAEAARLRQRRPSAHDLDQRARQFRDRGQIEEARTAFEEAVRQARADGDGTVEGDAELGLFTLVSRTSQSRPGSHQRLLEHARQAVAAYRRAGDREGERSALVAMITVLTDTADHTALDRTLERLAALDENQALWWRAYSTAMTGSGLAQAVAGLRWCVESADLLGDGADFYRQMCEVKLAYYEGRPLPLVDDARGADQIGAVTLDVMANGPSEAAARRLDSILQDVERIRRYARSQRVQHEVSDRHWSTYLTAVMCAEAAGDIEKAVDIHELGSSRALLSQAALHRLWRQWHPDVWEGSRSEALPALLKRHATAPTAHNRDLLMRAFGDQRRALESQERRLLSATPGPSMAESPVSVRTLRSMLSAEQRVVVFSPTGSIFLVAADGCRTIGRFPPRDVDAAVENTLAHLSNPASRASGENDGRAWLSAHLLRPIVENTPDDARVFLVPYGSMSQVPLGVLGPDSLSGRRETSYIPSLTILTRAMSAPRLVRTVERFVGLGDPDGTLPNARAEIEHAATTFLDPYVRFGDGITYHAAMANVADADVAHLGCHGLFFREYPDFSALLIGASTDLPQVLWYNELARYELNARLVVLAACHAGTGLTLFGSEYVGFPGAFLAAGARGVLAPLWAVSDGSTRILMRHFYTALEAGDSPAAALRKAQRAMAAEPATAHPYHWAGFQLFGLAPDYAASHG